MTSDWTTPAAVRAEVQRIWDRGAILAAQIERTALFPMQLRLRRPRAQERSDRFDEVRTWIRELRDGSRTERGAGYDIEWEEVESRFVGRNQVPRALVVPTEQDALFLIGKKRDARTFRELAERTLAMFPQLHGWIARRPMKVLENASEWTSVLAVLDAFRARPRPRVYARQLEIPNVDTKFVGAHKALLAELLDEVLGDEVDRATNVFESRYGLLTKPVTVRFRALDPDLSVGGFRDVSVPLAELARTPVPSKRVFVTENEINGLAFPEVPEAIVIFGHGYAVDRLGDLPWLREREIHYWGDIDTHGFAILDRLRASLPDVRSLLMDRATLLAHKPMWVTETDRHPGGLQRLSAAEAALFDELTRDTHGPAVRLEQERIGFAWVREALEELA